MNELRLLNQGVLEALGKGGTAEQPAGPHSPETPILPIPLIKECSLNHIGDLTMISEIF